MALADHPADAPASLADRLEAILGGRPRLVPVAAGYGIAIHRAEAGGARFAVKSGRADLPDHLAIEAAMLGDLRADGSLPVPEVIHAEADLLVMDWIETDGRPIGEAHERQAGEMLARLHATPRPGFGYPYGTTIGGLAQPNPEGAEWVGFFRDARLLHFARQAFARQHIDAALLARLEALAERLTALLPEPDHPALIHGDAWFGNVLVSGDRIAAWIDPALHHAHPEMELAYVTMHGTFARPFFAAYGALAPIDPAFEGRIDLYNIVPNLVHVMLAGPAYIAPIDAALRRHGL